jgi:phosphopentomutase
MSKKLSSKKPLIISGKEAKKALSIGLDRYVEMTGHKTDLAEYAGSLKFNDDEFDAMLQELKEDK